MTGLVLSAALGLWGSGFDTATLRPWATVLVAQATAAGTEEAPQAADDAKSTDDKAAEHRGRRGGERRDGDRAGRGPGRRGPGRAEFGQREGSDRGPRDRTEAGEHRGRGPRTHGGGEFRRHAGGPGNGPGADGQAHRGPRGGFGPHHSFADRGPRSHAAGEHRPEGRRPGGDDHRAHGPGHRHGPPAHFAHQRSGDSLFDQLDRDGDRTISRSEFNRGMARLIGFPGRPGPQRPERD